MPRENSSTPGRVDATVTEVDGRPVADLKAADFTLEANGKPQKLESVKFEKDQPLRLIVLIDDLSLPPDPLNMVRRTVREFIKTGLREGDEVAIVRTGAGSGGLDALTSDKAAMEAAIDRAHFNPESESAGPESAAVSLSVMRGILDGVRAIPGRKGLLFISTRIGERWQKVDARGQERLTNPAQRASTVLYAFDAAPMPQPALEQGLAAVVKDTGGRVFDSGDLSAALTRIAQEQRNYYVLTFGADDLGFDYLARTPRIDNLALKVARPTAVTRARNGYFGSLDYEAPDTEFADAVDSDHLDGGIRAKLTAMLSLTETWQVEVVMHVDARDISVVKGPDGKYRAHLESVAALLDPLGNTERDSARTLQAQMTEEGWARAQKVGFDYTAVLKVPREGVYTVYAVVRDSTSGRMGTARHFLRTPGFTDGKLAMSSIVVRGELEKQPDGSESVRDPLETGSVRSFQTGHHVTYAYSLFNVAADAEKRSEIETHSEIWRDGVRVYNAEPKSIQFPASQNPGRRSVSGVIAISDAMPPGGYVLRVTVTDKLTKRVAKNWMDFEVRP
jgi:VWFA-related protein